MSTPDRLPIDGSICIGCGLCCDGTLHDHVDVDESDEPIAAAAGLDLTGQDGKRVFRQPCARFSGGVCTVYSARPHVCRRYRCKLLKEVEDGRVGIAEAADRIALAKRLVTDVRGLAPGAITPRHRAALWRELEGGFPDMDETTRRCSGRIILALAALDQCLDRWFRKKKTSGSRQGEPG